MKYFLFRRITVKAEEHHHFYQLFKIVDDNKNYDVREDESSNSLEMPQEEIEGNKPNINFNEYGERQNSEYFYLPENDVESVSENNLYQIYYDGVDDKIFPETNIYVLNEILKMFYQKYRDFDLESVRPKTADEVINIVRERIKFQDDNIVDLVSRIYENYSVVTSPLPIELKEEQKTNILFHGPVGGGKKTISNIIAANIPMPTATITLVPETETGVSRNIVNIVNQLTKNGINDSMASIGVVFIKDNFSLLANTVNDPYLYINALTNCGPVSVNGHIIDFKMLTFVVLMDEYTEEDRLEVIDAMKSANCEYEVVVDKLTNSQINYILNSPYGRITYYKAYLEYLNKEFVINEESLKKLIKISRDVDMGMNTINQIIDKIVKKNAFEADEKVVIDDETVNLFQLMYDQTPPKVEKKKVDIIKSSVNEISNVVCQYVKGQDEHVKRLLYILLNNIRMANKDDLVNPKEYIDNILIQGESGSGKTFIIENIAKVLNIPYVIVDASQFTETGYVGASVDSILINLFNNSGQDLPRAQKGIVFMDEIDKKAGNSNQSDFSRGAVLNNLLKMVEGTKMSINVGTFQNPREIIFDTSRLTFIIFGAFEKIDKIIKKRLQNPNGRVVGFNNFTEDKYIDTDVTDDDFVEFGMQRQFVARFPEIIRLNKATKDFLIDIMKNSKSSALRIEKMKLEEAGFEIEYTDDFYEELALRTLKFNVGARGIKKAFKKILRDIHIEDIDANDIQKIIFTGEVVGDASKIILIKRENNKQKVIRK